MNKIKSILGDPVKVDRAIGIAIAVLGIVRIANNLRAQLGSSET